MAERRERSRSRSVKMRYQLTIHCESLEDFASIGIAIQGDMESRPPTALVEVIAEQVYTFDPTEEKLSGDTDASAG